MRPFESGIELESYAEVQVAHAAFGYVASQLAATACADFAAHYTWLQNETQGLIDMFGGNGEYRQLLIVFTEEVDVQLVLSALHTYGTSPKASNDHKKMVKQMEANYMAKMLQGGA